jgi:hypothetical protein
MFKALVGVKLSKVRCAELHEALEKMPGLLSLELVSAREILDLSVISRCCPRLESLQVFYSRGAQVNDHILYILGFPDVRERTCHQH